MPREFYVGRLSVSFTMCLGENQRFFVSRDIVHEMAALLREAVGANRCVVPVYCFMPDHLHMVIEGRSDDADLWRAAVGFKQRSGYWFSSHALSAHWQKDFHDHILRKYEDIKAHVLYILGNPVRRGIVCEWMKYPYSGCIGYRSLAEVLSLL